LKRSENPELLDSARIPKRYRDAKIAPIPALESFTSELRANLKSGQSLVLMGLPDTGKTESLCAICRMALDHTVRTMYVSAPDLLKAIRERALYEPHVLMEEAFRNRDLLAVDDLGAEIEVVVDDPRAARQTIVNMIRRRINDNKATIIATNSSEEQLTAEYGSGLIPILRRASTFVRTSPASDQAAKRTGELPHRAKSPTVDAELEQLIASLRSVILRRHLKQDEVAESIGVHRTDVNKWLNGKQKPRAENRRLICKFIEKSRGLRSS
jgi:DNA-binding XRE family transcriptional regulator